MGNVAGVMKKVNEAVSTEETAKIMQQFAVENEKMNMSEEMMDDALIDAVRFFADEGGSSCRRCRFVLFRTWPCLPTGNGVPRDMYFTASVYRERHAEG